MSQPARNFYQRWKAAEVLLLAMCYKRWFCVLRVVSGLGWLGKMGPCKRFSDLCICVCVWRSAAEEVLVFLRATLVLH